MNPIQESKPMNHLILEGVNLDFDGVKLSTAKWGESSFYSQINHSEIDRADIVLTFATNDGNPIKIKFYFNHLEGNWLIRKLERL